MSSMFQVHLKESAVSSESRQARGLRRHGPTLNATRERPMLHRHSHKHHRSARLRQYAACQINTPLMLTDTFATSAILNSIIVSGRTHKCCWWKTLHFHYYLLRYHNFSEEKLIWKFSKKKAVFPQNISDSCSPERLNRDYTKGNLLLFNRCFSCLKYCK